MALSRWVTVCLAGVVALSIVACGEDSDGGGAGGTGGSGGGYNGPVDQCVSAADTTNVAAEYDDQGNIVPEGQGRTVSQLVTTCTQCLSLTGAERDTCILDCVKPAVGGNVSDACLGCVILSTTCSIDSGCVGACLLDPTTQRCLDCRCGVGDETTTGRNCVDEYEACAGIPSTSACN